MKHHLWRRSVHCKELQDFFSYLILFSVQIHFRITGEMLFLNESNRAAEIKAKDVEQLLRLNKCSYYVPTWPDQNGTVRRLKYYLLFVQEHISRKGLSILLAYLSYLVKVGEWSTSSGELSQSGVREHWKKWWQGLW